MDVIVHKLAVILLAVAMTLLLADAAMALGPHTFGLAQGEFGSFVEISGLGYDGFGVIFGISDTISVSGSYLFCLSLGASCQLSSSWLLDGAIGFDEDFNSFRARLAYLYQGGRGASAYALGVGAAYDGDWGGTRPYLEAELNLRGAYLQLYYLFNPGDYGISLGLSTSF